jgi:hypothetical protein
LLPPAPNLIAVILERFGLVEKRPIVSDGLAALLGQNRRQFVGKAIRRLSERLAIP